jgi:type I restriction enzyme S subunit
VKTRTVHLDALCERIDYGFTASADFSLKEPRLLRITDIQEGSVDWNHVPGCRITPEEEADKRLCAGDIVFARTGATTGKCFLIEHAPRAVFASYLIRLRTTDEILPHYLYAFFQSEHYWHQIKGAVRGAAQGGVNSTTLSSLMVPVPDLTEQRRIAERLEQTDRLRRTRRYALELTNTFLPAAFLELFGDHHQAAREYPTKPLEEVVQLDRGITYGIVQAGPHIPDGVPYIKTGDIIDGVICADGLWRTAREIADSYQRSEVKFGDLVMSIRATVGTVAVLPKTLDGANLTQGTARIAPGPEVDKLFLLWQIRMPEAQHWISQQIKGTTFLEITLGRLREMPVFVPPLPLQQNFAALVERVERLRAVQREALRQAEHLFASLLHRAFSG